MAIYKGFSTKTFNHSDPATIVGLADNNFGPYNLTDKNLIIMDLINHFNIRKGEKLMNPNFGCLIWDRLFEPLTPALKDAITKDVTEIIQADPRIDVLQRVQLSQSTDGLGILLTADIIIKNTNELVSLNLAFDGTSGVVNTTVNY
jgi:phage baseplate assembly protein W